MALDDKIRLNTKELEKLQRRLRKAALKLDAMDRPLKDISSQNIDEIRNRVKKAARIGGYVAAGFALFIGGYQTYSSVIKNYADHESGRLRPGLYSDRKTAGMNAAENFISQSLDAYISGWARAWEKNKGYGEFYSTDFVSENGQNRQEYLAAKDGLFAERQGTIRIDVSGIRAEPISGDSVRVTFFQRYSSSKYSDFGKKELILKNYGSPENSDWKIASERFSRIYGG